MKRLLLFVLSLLFVTAVTGDEPQGNNIIKTWDYSNWKQLDFQIGRGIKARRTLDKQTLTPDKQQSLKIEIFQLREDAKPWELMVIYDFKGNLEAETIYEVEFWCKGSVPGEIQATTSLLHAPWSFLTNGAIDAVATNWKKISYRFKLKKNMQNIELAMPRLMLAQYGSPATIHVGPVVLKKVPPSVPFSLNKNWQLLLEAEELETLDRIPPEGTKLIQLHNFTYDLKKEMGSFRAGQTAIFFNEFESPENGLMRIGVAADWWLDLHINGKRFFHGGNEEHTFSPDAHVLEMPVRKGRNLFAAKIGAGMDGWKFVCGKPNRPPDSFNVCSVSQGKNWRPLDMQRIRVLPGTALDLSEINGKRLPIDALGRIIVSPEGKLVPANTPERPIRFFAYNFGMGDWRLELANWQKQDMEDFSASVARQGYNMLRLHYVDQFLLNGKSTDYTPPRVSFGNCPMPQKESELKFDSKYLDQFDYLLYCLKKNGIYINLDLMSDIRGYTKASPGSCRREEGFKVQLFFNTTFRKNWEAGVAFLLNRTNPYTGTRLKDDPQIVLVEPLNEQDLMIGKKADMQEMAPGFRKWLQKKYSSDQELQTAWGQRKCSLQNPPLITEELLRKGDPCAADAGQFLIDSMTELSNWYIATIRKHGYRGLITQWDMIMRTMELPVRARMPAIAQHTYFSHPAWRPNSNLMEKSMLARRIWGNNDIFVPQASSLNSSYFRAAAVARFLDRPYLITEYSHSCFNRYRHERGLFFGSYAALQGWDSLTAHGNLVIGSKAQLDPIAVFESGSDPISRASEVVAAFAWLRGDIKEAPHSVALQLSSRQLFPQSFLAAIGDDYAKMAMLTKIGILFPEIKAAEKTADIQPDLSFQPKEFSKLNVETWAASAASGDGTQFEELLTKLKERSILPQGNKSDYRKKIYQSETGELLLDEKNRTMQVVTPRLEGVIIKKDVPFTLQNLSVQKCSQPASVAMVSLDGRKSLPEARRLLLIFATNALNHGSTFDTSAMACMIELGSLPVIVQSAELHIRQKTTASQSVQVYPLHLDGSRMKAIPATLKNGIITLQINTAELQNGTVFFEILLT